jgi:3-deoxy-7-phosphoheptulonate synthase
MSVGFKNGTDGSMDIAVDAIKSSQASHTFLSVTKQGLTAIVETEGNDTTHVILRGSTKGPNYEAQFVEEAGNKLKKAGLNPRLMVDCSHGNSNKKHERQIDVGRDIAAQLSGGGPTASMIMGVMIESNINEGNQKVPLEGPSALKYGVSITDACISMEQTLPLLDELRAGIQARRAAVKAKRAGQ